MKINHDLRSVDGQTIYHLPEIGGASGAGNLALPNIFSESETPLYPIGTRFVIGDRTFRYFKAGGTITKRISAIVSNSAMLKSEGAVYGNHAAGVSVVEIDGDSAGIPAANKYAGGLILFQTASYSVMRIISSTRALLTPSPYAVALTMEQPIPDVLADNTVIEILPNRYASCVTAWGGAEHCGNNPVVGLPARRMTDQFYGWVQTWGPCICVVTDVAPGTLTFDQMCIFESDGTIAPLDVRINGGDSPQIAGYTLCAGNNTTGWAGSWIYLMIDP